MTSDKFFINNSDKFDLIFIDGLHEYSQVMRDIKNLLTCLAHNGVILLHDCLPRNIWNQVTARINSDWNCDVWKAIVECRTYDHIDTYTCIADQGIGVIIPKANGNKLTLKNVIFKELKYRDYYYNHEEYMNLIDCKKLYEIIK